MLLAVARQHNCGVYTRMGQIAKTACLLAMMFPASSATPMPWTMPGDFRQRLHISDLVVSGTIEDVSAVGLQRIDRIELNSYVARVRVDRVFQGRAAKEFWFTWYKHYVPAIGGGVVGDGPPTADFRPHQRYLIFLKQEASKWVVAMPVYALEVKLAPMPPSSALRDLSQVLPEQRYEALAEELETAALLVPVPQPGLTGEAATYFPAVFDLLAGCAEPFYRRFLSSPSPELRGAALRWLCLLRSRRMACNTAPTLD